MFNFDIVFQELNMLPDNITCLRKGKNPGVQLMLFGLPVKWLTSLLPL